MAELRRCRPYLGTFVDIRASGRARRLPAAVDAAFRAVARVQSRMSFHDPASDVARINRAARRRAVVVSRDTWEVLRAARRFAEASGGLFDPTVAPALVRWGYLPRPRPGRSPRRADHRAIELLPGRRVRLRADVWIDLGGIAKGHAVDRAARALEAAGVRDYVVNAGGDLRIGRRAEPVWARHPRLDGRWVPLGLFRRTAVATSADGFSRRVRRGRMRRPLVRPATGAPARGRGSVTVVAPSGRAADALTKVAALGGDRATVVLRAFGARSLTIPHG